MGLRCPLSLAAMAAWASPGVMPSNATAWALRMFSFLRTIAMTLSKFLQSSGMSELMGIFLAISSQYFSVYFVSVGKGYLVRGGKMRRLVLVR